MTAYRTVVITGASSGLGAGFAERLAPMCTNMVLTARREPMLRDLAAKIFGPRVHLLPADIADSAAYRAQLQALLAPLPPCDLVILNAGIGQEKSIVHPQLENMHRVFGVNLFGAAATLDAIMPSMLREGKGHIVGISSVAGIRGLPRLGAYSASKAAMTNWLEAVRGELSRTPISVTTIHPGFVETPMTENNGKMPFLQSLDSALDQMMSAIHKKKQLFTFPWQMRFLGVFAARPMPAWLYRRFIRKYGGRAALSLDRARKKLDQENA